MTLKDLCVVDWGNTNLTKSSYVEGGKFLAVSAAGCDGRIGHSEHSKHTPVLSAIGAQCGKMFFPEEDFTAIKNTITLTPRDGKCIGKFLYYLFTFVELPQRGAGQPFISKGDIQSFEVTCPLIPEQQWIVGLLDEAFAGIATAQANAEKNLQNARALFASHLQSVFTQRGKAWTDATIGGVIRFIDYRGKTPVKTASGIRLITAKNVKMGYLQETPTEFIAAASYKGWMTRGIPQKGDVLFTTEAPLANVAQLDTDEKVAFAQRIIIMQPEKTKLDCTFLKYLLLSEPVQQRIRAKGTGATVQGIKASLLKLIEISFPKTLTEQNQIVAKLDSLSEQTQRLETLYERKLAALTAWKKSLLNEAFTGELTKELPQPVIAPLPPLLPLLPPIPALRNITPINLHAGILAIGYQAYEQAGRQWHFGHVVAEKFSHMTEAMAGIDLGRNPVQDHFGPDDHNHFKKLEHRARMANYFTFQAGKKGKIFVKGRGFESLVAKTRAALGELNQKLDEVIKLMLPMDMERAEVFATIYAAWNNLLMDKQTPTNEQIVLAARENWHPDKLKIARENFFKTIDWIRKKNICPQGKGKRVIQRS